MALNPVNTAATELRPNVGASLLGLDRFGLLQLMAAPEKVDAFCASSRHRTRDFMARLYGTHGQSATLGEPLWPKRLQKVVGQGWTAAPMVQVRHHQQSLTDGSIRLALGSGPQGQTFESVLIPERGRLTQCLSTQVGCAQGCRFCRTGTMGLVRQLSAAEIVSQVLVGQDHWRRNRSSVPDGFGADRVTNIVFMGMGEPLDNIDEVLLACRILTDPWGLGVAPTRVTVSTVGLVDGLKRLLVESSVQVAWSLHSPFEEERSRIVPANQRHSIAEILEVFRHCLPPKRHVFVQYTLLRGVNDSLAHAREIARLFQDIPCKINLIPLNEHDRTGFRRPALESVAGFRKILRESGHVVTVRLSKGQDIFGACGQLAETL